MGRKRVELSSADETEIATRMRRGESVRTIATALGGRASVATIDRRMRELRANPAPARGKLPRPVQPPPDPPKSDPVAAEPLPDSVPEGTPLADIEKWMRRVELAADKAEKDGNLTAFASLMTRLRAFEDARRKATPLPKADPNDDPDMIALGEQAEKKFFQLLDDALRKVGL